MCEGRVSQNIDKLTFPCHSNGVNISPFIVALAIEAMKNAHRAELKRAIQRACHENNNAGDMNLGEICRQHR